MKDLLLSFVLPCYNVDKFIGECLDSLLLQDISPDEYEIICVNDCSSDSTEDIIQQYQSKHRNIRLINHDVNKTAGAARNTGLEYVRGKYVWFIDPDDLIERNVLKQLLTHCENGNLDILIFNYSAIHKGQNAVSEIKTYPNSPIMNGIDFLKTFFSKKISSISMVWLGIFRTEFIKCNHIEFPILFFGEDSIFVWKSFLYSQKIQSIPDAMYIYRVNDSSIASTFTANPGAEKFLSRYLLFPFEIYKLLREFGKQPSHGDIMNDLKISIRWFLYQFQNELSTLNRIEREKLFVLCKSHKGIWHKLLPYMGWRMKLLYLRLWL